MASILSDGLKSSTENILTNSTSQIMLITCTLSSPDNPDFNITINQIKSLDTIQSYSDTYMDYIEIEFDLTPTDYQQVMQNYQNLNCSITISSTNLNTTDEQNILHTFEYKFIMQNKEDIFKNVPSSNLIASSTTGTLEHHNSTYIPVTAQLVDPIIYKIRQQQINFILNQASVKDTLHFLAYLFGIKDVHIIAPDNTTKYNTIIVPPMMNFSNVFNYIHRKYGVYNQGFNYYYSNGILYIYPAFKVSGIESPSTIHIYQVGNNHLSGADSYHYFDNLDLHLISNTSANNKQLLDQQLENIGSSFIVQNGNNVIDNWRIVNADGSFTIPDTGIQAFQIDTDKGIETDTHHPLFKFSNNNTFMHMSELSQVNLTPITLGWEHAVLFSFKPGWKVCYHYDDQDNIYKIDDGICTSVTYSIKPIQQLDKQMYTCKAQIDILTSLT